MDSESSEEDDLDEVCIICEERGKDEEWYKCGGCGGWAHALCSGWSKKEIQETRYECDFCRLRNRKAYRNLKF